MAMTNRRLTKSRKEVHDFWMSLFPDLTRIIRTDFGVSEWKVWYYKVNEDGAIVTEQNEKGEHRPIVLTESGVY